MTDFRVENDLIIGTSAGRILVRIKPDGTLTYGPSYTPDEAAEVFWQALARRRAAADKDAPVKEALYQHMEKLLLAAGHADLANQVARDRENELMANPNASQSERMRAHLEAKAADEDVNQAATRLVELGRRLALRGAEDPVSEAAPSGLRN